MNLRDMVQRALDRIEPEPKYGGSIDLMYRESKWGETDATYPFDVERLADELQRELDDLERDAVFVDGKDGKQYLITVTRIGKRIGKGA